MPAEKTPQDAVLELLAYKLTELREDQVLQTAAQKERHDENKARLQEIDKKLDSLKDLTARNDERTKSLEGWRNGTVASIVALGIAMFRQKFGF